MTFSFLYSMFAKIGTFFGWLSSYATMPVSRLYGGSSLVAYIAEYSLALGGNPSFPLSVYALPITNVFTGEVVANAPKLLFGNLTIWNVIFNAVGDMPFWLFIALSIIIISLAVSLVKFIVSLFV